MADNEKELLNENLSLNDYFTLIRPTNIPNNGRNTFFVNQKGIKLEIFRTNHIPDISNNEKTAFVSYGLLIDDRILVSCDTKFDRELIEKYGDKVEAIFHDVSFVPNPVHANIHELKSLPKKYQDKMFLMHYFKACEKIDHSEFRGLAIEGVHYIFD